MAAPFVVLILVLVGYMAAPALGLTNGVLRSVLGLLGVLSVIGMFVGPAVGIYFLATADKSETDESGSNQSTDQKSQ
jgi:hypothetical protein